MKNPYDALRARLSNPKYILRLKDSEFEVTEDKQVIYDTDLMKDGSKTSIISTGYAIHLLMQREPFNGIRIELKKK